MAVKRALRKDTFRDIKRTFNRFVSILIIVGMGCGFFAGVKATAPSMKQTAENYFNEQNLMDMKLLSTFGFEDSDLEEIQKVEGVEKVYPSYSADLLAEEEDGRPVIKVVSISDQDEKEQINRVELVDGRMPEKANECVVEGTKFANKYEIGDKVTLADMTGDTNVSDVLTNKVYTVVGKVKSPMYISYEHESTYVGDGTVSTFIMVPRKNFLYTRYTEVYVTCKTDGMSTFSKEYKKQIKKVSKDIEVLGEDSYNKFKSETETQIATAEGDLESKKAEAQKQLEDAKTQLNDARNQLQKAMQELTAGKTELEKNEKYTQEQLQASANKINSARAQLQEAGAKLQAGQSSYESGRAQYEAQTVAARQQLDSGWAQYNAGAAELNAQAERLTDAQNQLKDGQIQYNNGVAQLDKGKQELQQGKQQLVVLEQTANGLNQYCNTMQSSIDAMISQGATAEDVAEYQKALDDGKAQLSSLQSQLESARTEVANGEAQIAEAEQQLANSKAQLDAAQAEIDAGQAQINTAKSQLDSSRSQLEAGESQYTQETADGKARLESAYAELQAGQAEYQAGMKQVADGQTQLDAAKKKADVELSAGREKIASGEKELAEGQKELTENEKKYNEAVKDAESQIMDGDKRIQDAKKSIGAVQAGVWYVFGREGNPGYTGFADDAGRIDAIAGIFPVFFLLVAVLVCLTTMTRMVEEQRGQIGTMKALGYSNWDIASKYFTYSSLAGVIGSVIGIVLGSLFLPRAIVQAYDAMYDLPSLQIMAPWGSAIGAFVAGVICTTSVALITCYKELRVCPAQLMRPKTPKEGKRILLERIPGLWKKLSFSHKVTARNLFRYKGRLTMTIIGIAGCTSLIMAGLGLQDAISDIVPKQFEQIYDYNTIFTLRSNEDQRSIKETEKLLDKTGKFECFLPVYQESASVYSSSTKKVMDAYLFIPRSSEELSDFVKLHERNSDKEEQLEDDGAIITEKLAATYGVKKGDSLTFKINDIPYAVTVAGIAENYVQHYIYLSPSYYEDIMGTNLEFNSLIGRTGDLNAEEQKDLTAALLKNSDFTSVLFTDSVISNFASQIEGLNMVVYIMIFAAGALAFVVLYNLTNINISERIREIATIKVLGFYDNEVNMYVYRENIVMTAIGIIAGLVLGFFISKFMVLTIEMDIVMFGREIQLSSFVVSAMLTLLFSIFVNLVMAKKIKKISMVESLKSVE